MHVTVSVWLGVVPGPGTGAHQTPPSSCDLLQPGVLCLRSIFCYQSSFFSRHLDQALDVNQNPPSAKREMWRIS